MENLLLVGELKDNLGKIRFYGFNVIDPFGFNSKKVIAVFFYRIIMMRGNAKYPSESSNTH